MTRIKPGILALAVALALLLAAGTWTAARAYRAVEQARLLKAEVSGLKAELAAVDGLEDLPAALETGRAGLASVEARYTELRREVAPFEGLLGWLGWVPAVGDDLAAVPHTLDLVAALIETAHHLDAGLSPLVELVDGGQLGETGALAAVAAAAVDAEPELRAAEQSLAAGHAARAAVADPAGLAPELREALADADQALALLDRGLAATAPYLPALPPLLGLEGPHHVLILLQNADELRPTGGWITAAVYVTLERGEVAGVEVLNSHDLAIDRFAELSYGEPPAPLRDYMDLPIWAFRDANWSPDFPTAATRALELFTAGRGAPVDTVLAVDQYTLRDFMAAAGPLSLADLTRVDQDNLIGFLRDSWAESYKDVLPEVAPLLIERLLDVRSVEDALVRWQAVQRATARNDLLMYSTKPAIQALAEALGWDGAVPASPGDYLYTVEANVGYNKVNLNIERRLSYHVSLADPAAPYARLRVEYTNRSRGEVGACWDRQGHEGEYIDRAHDCYGNYLRLYLPDGARLVEPPRFEIPASYRFVSDPAAGQFHALPDERGREVYGGLVVVPIGETLAAEFTSLLPPREVLSVRPDGALVYRLLVQKQPGVPPFPLTVAIDLPAGAGVLEVTPEPTYFDGSTAYFERTQNSDFELQVVMRLPGGAPAGLPAEAMPAASPTPRVLPTAGPLPTIPPEVRFGATPSP